MSWVLIAPIAAIAAVISSIYLYFYVSSKSGGTPKMQEISEAIRQGARAFLKREYTALAAFVVIMAVILTVTLGVYMGMGVEIGPAYVFGSICSAIAGFLGMEVALKANGRTAYAAREGLNKAFPIAFRGGAVMGLSVVGLALLGVSVVYFSQVDLSLYWASALELAPWRCLPKQEAASTPRQRTWAPTW